MSGHENGSQQRSVLQFEAEPAAVRDLRRVVRRQLAEWRLSALADEAELAVSELAANVIKHVGRGAAAALVLEVAADRLRIELHDKSHRVPVLGSTACDDECGRGLHLLRRLGCRLGHVADCDGEGRLV